MSLGRRIGAQGAQLLAQALTMWALFGMLLQGGSEPVNDNGTLYGIN